MTIATLTITAFLLARIADDQAAARAPLAPDPEGIIKALFVDDRSVVTEAQVRALADRYTRDMLARHDPARVLAECEAKRAIVDAAWQLEWTIDGEWGSSRSKEQMERDGVLPDILRHLAAPYADHPDYDESWAVQ